MAGHLVLIPLVPSEKLACIMDCYPEVQMAIIESMFRVTLIFSLVSLPTEVLQILAGQAGGVCAPLTQSLQGYRLPVTNQRTL